MSQPKINLKQNIKHNTAQYGFEGVMKHFLKVLFDTEAPLLFTNVILMYF